MVRKSPTSYRLSDEARKLLGKLSKKNAISRCAMLEVLIRKEAKAQKVKA